MLLYNSSEFVAFPNPEPKGGRGNGISTGIQLNLFFAVFPCRQTVVMADYPPQVKQKHLQTQINTHFFPFVLRRRRRMIRVHRTERVSIGPRLEVSSCKYYHEYIILVHMWRSCAAVWVKSQSETSHWTTTARSGLWHTHTSTSYTLDTLSWTHQLPVTS